MGGHAELWVSLEQKLSTSHSRVFLITSPEPYPRVSLIERKPEISALTANSFFQKDHNQLSFSQRETGPAVSKKLE